PDSRPRQLQAGTPGPEGGEGARFLRRDESGSQDSQLAGRGEGARADAHIPRPQPTPRTKWALSRPPVPSPPGRSGGAPRRGKGAAGKRSGERQGPVGTQPGASQRADGGHPAPTCASRAITGRGSRSRARGSAGKARAGRRVTERRAAATGSPPWTGCSMGGGAAGTGEGCSAAVSSGSSCVPHAPS
ncbi:uncharacterized protein LOC112394853, partial [Neophocaena asiaeorientalis asiaeorientalis]|uniref:Uncharacterized protein LOC112394853 n=1 Tax=Neophocaena asiaeorientalis asiaeorientalis TaxID=1706337 RepID=A0A341AW57_NEOAA